MAERTLDITIICILLWIEAIFWIIIGILWFRYPYFHWFIFHTACYFILLFIGILLVPITFGVWKLKSWTLLSTLLLNTVIIFIDIIVVLPLGIADPFIIGYSGYLIYVTLIRIILGELIPLIIVGYILFVTFKERPSIIRNLSWSDAIFWIGFGGWIAVEWSSRDGEFMRSTIIMWGLIMIFLGILAFLIPSSLLNLKPLVLWLTIVLVNLGIICLNIIIMEHHYTTHYSISADAGYCGYYGCSYEYYLLEEILSMVLDGFGNIIPIIIIVYALLSISKVKGKFPL